MATKAKKRTASARPQPEPAPPAEPTEAQAVAEDEDPTLEMEFETQPVTEPETEVEVEVEPAPEPEPPRQPTPSGFQAPAEEPQDGPISAPADPDPAEPTPGEMIILNGPASYGPVIIDGRATRCYKGKPVRVPDPNERLTILGTGRFRLATDKDVREAKRPSAGRGGPITKDLLPPGAIKGGLTQR
jgi:hypothetical protein